MKTDIIEQKEFDLLTEKNDIVITNNLKNDLVKQLDKIFDGKVKESSTEPFTTIHTLGKIKAKRVHIVNFDKLDKMSKRYKIFKSISALKGDVTVLVDTFETKETYLEIMQVLSEKILTNNYKFTKAFFRS